MERRYTPSGSKYSGRSSVLGRFGDVHSLGYELAKRNIKARFRQSVLGVFWIFLPPLSTSLIWIFLNGQGVISMEKTDVPYPLFVLTGTTLWQVLTRSIMAPLTAANQNKSILIKINFPREAILIAAFYEQLLNLVAAILIVGIAMLSFGQVPDLHVFAGLLMLVLILAGGIFLGVFLLPVGILYKDVQFALPSFMQVLMYLTPVVYPKPVFDGVGKLLEYNPFTPVLISARSWLLGTANAPGMEVLVITLAAVVLLGLLALLVFRITMEVLVERMGA